MRERYRLLLALDERLMQSAYEDRTVLADVSAMLLDWGCCSEEDAEWIRDNGDWLHVGNCWLTVAELWADDEREFRFDRLLPRRREPP